METLERCCQARLPSDFTDYLQLSNGLDHDQHIIHFWTIEEMVAAHQTSEDPAHLVFADYCLQCHLNALHLATGQVVLLGGYKPIAFAASFREFIALVLDGIIAHPVPFETETG